MGAIAAAISKKGEDTVPSVRSMLIRLKHRGTDAHGIATPNSTRTANSIEQISTKNVRSDIALGHNLCQILPKDHPQPVLGENHALVFEGRIFPPFGVSDVDAILGMLGSNPRKNARSIIKRFDGSYTFAITCQDMVIAGRDVLGIAPLYYGENETTAAIASERKALWLIGIEAAKSFPPGTLAVINCRGFRFKPIRTLAQPSPNPMYMKPAARCLQTLLIESMRRRLSDTKRAAVAFSGGLDSSIVAVLAKLCTVEVQLITVGLKGQRELEHAKAAAKVLEIPLHLQTYTLDDVEKTLPKVLWLIEEPDVMKAEIAIPLFWTAEIAAKLDFRILLAGQGADELFGGYQRYLKDYAAGIEVICDSMYHDIIMCHEKNFQRDNQVCSFHKVELRLPFADREVASFALGLPPRLKIESSEDLLRKRVLRLTAENLGQPQSIAGRPKKAIQYATGVNKALRRLARVEGSTLREYVERYLQEVYPER
ncbi:MAG: asparagine synthetase B [Candidatus Bathyarchaeota archaeon]|nr:MAG: asparagine synthetase B [Candidatus Bathyarchaeota archaeon]